MMGREWMALFGAMGFIVMIMTSTFIMIRIEEGREKRERRKRDEASPTPPPARH